MKMGRIFRTWAPMEAAWLLMAVEGPFISAVIARLTDATLNLAAFGVSFPLAMLFESPIILIMSASTALVEDRDSYAKLKRFTWALNALITLAMLIFVLPPVFVAVTRGLMGLPESVTSLAHGACILLLPWPAAIGYRRFYQGLLIRKGLTHRVAFGTALRLGSMGGTALLLAAFTGWPGAWVGAGALSTGVCLEAAASRFWARDCVRELKQREPGGQLLSYRSIASFYLPLALFSMLNLGVNPLISFFLGHSYRALESLAVMPVVNVFIFMFSTVGLTLQEVAIPVMGSGAEARATLRRFAALTALTVSCILALVAFTPLSRFWLQGVAGLSPALASLAVLPVAILFLLPALTVLASYQRASLVVSRQTRPITWATALEVGTIALVLLVLTRHLGWVGATAAACALMAGRVASSLYLLPSRRPGTLS
ncbi:MAG: hypothetical protein H6Q00_2120 [Holophagaceae bacterium]|nr:hypothetical protein [Holophagaceae bacterium]